MLRITTWNLNGLDDQLLDERSEAACLRLLLRESPPDVVLLQEVVRRSWHAHLKHHFAAAGYVAVPPDPTVSDHEYFVLAFVRASLSIEGATWEPFANSSMGRGLLAVEVVPKGGKKMWIATAHLESGREASPARIAQLRHALQRLLEREGPAIFAGDLNLRVAEEKQIPELADVTDAWEAAGKPKADRVTWPSIPRPMPGGRGPGGARFDRVYLRHAMLQRFARIGERPGPTIDEPPSDHVGVEVDVIIQ